jgi:hypothetical protein
LTTNPPPKAPFKPAVATNTPNPAQQPTRTIPQTAEAIARAETEKARQALVQAHSDRVRAEADAREREGKAIHRHGVWKGLTIGVVLGIPLGVAIVFLAAMSLQDRFSVERWSGAREAVSNEMRAGIIEPPPASIAKPQQ